MAGQGSWVGFVALLSLTAPFAIAGGQNDAGTGGDAPDDWHAAVSIGPGHYTAALDPDNGDFQDWFLVNVPQDMGLHVHAHAEDQSGIDVQVLTDDGAPLTNHCCDGEFGYKCCGPDADAVVRTHTARVGVFAAGVRGEYLFDVEIVPLINVRIASVQIGSVPITVGATETPVSTQRVVHVTIANDGPGAALATGVNVRIRHDLSPDRDLGGFGLPAFPAGRSITVDVPWDTTGEIGDVIVDANTGSPLDTDGSDNDANVHSWVLVGNLGTGVDVFASNVNWCDQNGCLTSTTGWNGWGKGWWLDWNTNNGHHVHSHIGTHPGFAHWQSNGESSAGSWWFDVGTRGVQQIGLCPAATAPSCVQPSPGGVP